MTDSFKAVMTNNYFSNHHKYCKVEITANDINELNRICGMLNLLRADKIPFKEDKVND